MKAALVWRERMKDQNRIYIIAEIGGNFTTFKQAQMMIDAASRCGVDAVKLQTYRAKTLTSRTAMFAFEATGNIPQYELFEKYEISAGLHEEVFAYARSKGLDVFSTPSHITDVEMLEKLGCPMYKIGSDDAVNIPFLKQVTRTGKPIILATGMCTIGEVDRSVNAILEEGCTDLSLLHAVSLYPTHREDVNLSAIETMKDRYPHIPVGYSDHTYGITACVCAAAMGAELIEKHFTYDKNADGPDHGHSADEKEMMQMVHMVRDFEAMRGSGVKAPAPGEAAGRINNRKSVVLIKDMEEGECLTEGCFEIMRPGNGIQPCDVSYAIGRRMGRAMKKNEIVRWGDLK